MKEEKVSIVVAAYNVERYIEECIMSIENQSYRNIEVIIIDDGSKDRTGAICDRLRDKYDNIIVEHIKNSGVSKARNIAISMSTGEYLAFVDGDDYIKDNMISLMIKKIKNKQADLCACNYSYLYTNRNETAQFIVPPEMNQEEAKIELFKNNSIKGFLCNKIFKAQCIKENTIYLNEKISMCEDLLFCFKYMQHIKKIVTVDEPLYYYRMRKSSASNSIKKKNTSVFLAFEEMHKLDNKVYEYSKDLYAYVYFKYYREVKKEKKKVKKLNLINTILNKDIKRRTKIYSIIFLILPQNIQNKMKIIKKDNMQYYE